MKRQDVLQRIKADKKALNDLKVASLSIFGSVARDEAIPGSDVDILVDFTEPVGLFHFARLKLHLETLLEARVDLVTPGALKQETRTRILSEAIRAVEGPP